MPKQETSFARRTGHYLSNLVIVGLIRLALALPYETRIPLVGRFVRDVVGPLAGYRRRALSNLKLIWPDLPETEREKIARQCLDNMGRSFIENYSEGEFPARMAGLDLEGPGFPVLETAARQKRPVLLVTGHYGNYEAVRAALVARNFDVGGLFRNMANPYFNAHYVRTMEAFGGPVFPQGRAGTSGFIRHLRKGGQLVLLFDQHVFRAPLFDFLGQPANTATSAAEMALRYDALLIPFYGIRQPDGLGFRAVLEAPVAHSDPITMTKALTDSLAARIREDPTQWFWVHRRWRPVGKKPD